MNPFVLVAFPLALSPCLLGFQDPTEDPQGDSPRDSIRAEELQADVTYLASDELLGREAGSPEAMLAARYLAQRLQRAGVQPAGDEGTFFQGVPLFHQSTVSKPVLSWTTAEGEAGGGEYGIHYESFNGSHGCGSATVAIVRGPEDIPEAFEAPTAVYLDGSSSDRRAWLGAVRELEGVVLILERGSARDGTRPRDVRASTRLVIQKERPEVPRIRVRGALAEALADGSVITVALEAGVELTPAPSANVVGVIPGVGTEDNPELATEAIVFSAHYDHIGVRGGTPGEGEDAIRNGADDDASGCATVLELAEAFGKDEAPARTLIFLLATAEEKGLLGTYHYIESPWTALENTVCNLNFEMLGRPDAEVGGAGKLWLTGFERSNLGPKFQELGLGLLPDPRLDQNFFQRSDNYAFAKLGIVAQTLSSYNMHGDYHQVTDEVAAIDFDHMQAAARDAYTGARALADGTLTPAWNPGGDPSK